MTPEVPVSSYLMSPDVPDEPEVPDDRFLIHLKYLNYLRT
jgi:hypothetical protein